MSTTFKILYIASPYGVLTIFVEEKMEGLVLCPANHVPLTPLSFLERAAFVYRKKIGLIHGNISYSWEELHGRCVKLASALSQLGVSSGDVVSIYILFTYFTQIKSTG